MGQYYRPIVLKQNWKNKENNDNPVLGSLLCYDYDNGAKLMEHSYVGNNFVKAVIAMIDTLGQGKAVPFVWCGDYADPVKVDGKPVEQDEFGNPSGGINLYRKADVWLDSNEDGKTIKDLIKGKKVGNLRYIINETKKQFVKIPKTNKDTWNFHPLPLLCAFGNGRGCGDYHGGENEKLIGSWAFDEIRFAKSKNDVMGYDDVNWIDEGY